MQELKQMNVWCGISGKKLQVRVRFSDGRHGALSDTIADLIEKLTIRPMA